MGTLLEQPPRDGHIISEDKVKDYVNVAKRISMEEDISYDQALKTMELFVRDRANNLYKSNGDIHDEQMAGIGEMLWDIKNAIEKIADDDQS